jgi:hypothetical protein
VAHFKIFGCATKVPQLFCTNLKILQVVQKQKNLQNVGFAGFTILFENFAFF